jgi:TetR/AcrR family transcriptional repressor of nem operon
MPKASSKRERLAKAAIDLAYRQGFAQTSIADIAKEAGVPVGNVYYYFKTREDIGDAMIGLRLSQFHHMREAFDEMASPKARLVAFVHMTLDNRQAVARFGCPFGSLSAELLKGGGVLAERCNVLFSEPMDWLERQFAEMGTDEAGAAQAALHLQSSLQGASLLTQSYRKPELLEAEAKRLIAWIEELT